MDIINRTIKHVTNEYLEKSCELVEKVFTDYKDEKEGKIVRDLVEEIIGYAMFSRFQLEGRYEDELLILTPVAVRTDLHRQHISKDIIEYGFEKAKEMGFTAVLVEGNPANYNSRGFVTSSDYGIVPGKDMHLPKVECLMIKELVPGALEKIHGVVDYSMYKTLSGEKKEIERD